MKSIITKFAIAVCGLALSSHASQAMALEGESGVAEVSGGQRVAIEERGFSIIPPVGWEVYKDHPSLTLLMQVPYEKGMRYQRTIQVASFSGPRFIDEVTAREFEKIITRKFSEASVSVADYRIRNHMQVELNDGREGLLFYSEFNLDGVPLMQAHILISSQSRHFMMTFTDVTEHFEDEEANRFLTEAWNSMISAELDTRTPVRYESIYYVAAGFGVFILFGLAVWFLRRVGSRKKYEDFAAGKGLEHVTAMDDDDDDDDDADEELVPVSTQAEAVSEQTSSVDGLTNFDDEAI